MNPTTETTLIAGSISLIGLIVNLYIARRTHKTTIESIQLKAKLDETKLINDAFRELESEAEKLRIRCWDLIALFEISISGSDDYNDITPHMDEIKDSLNEFGRQNKIFLDAWANVKTELPEKTDWYFRIVRHSGRKYCMSALNLGNNILRDFDKSPETLYRKINPMIDVCNHTLTTLDKLIVLIASLRKGKEIMADHPQNLT